MEEWGLYRVFFCSTCLYCALLASRLLVSFFFWQRFYAVLASGLSTFSIQVKAIMLELLISFSQIKLFHKTLKRDPYTDCNFWKRKKKVFIY